MAGPTIARNYQEAFSIAETHKNSILEVNADGSIRTQNLKEKIGNLGLRIISKYTATKAEKDAKVAQAIQNLFVKTGQTLGTHYSPENQRVFYRFFHPEKLQKRVATKEVESKTGAVFIQASNASRVNSQKVPAQKVLFSALADTFTKFAFLPEFHEYQTKLEALATTYRTLGRNLKADDLDPSLSRLQKDLEDVELQLGRGRLEEYDISAGVQKWAETNAPDDLARHSTE